MNEKCNSLQLKMNVEFGLCRLQVLTCVGQTESPESKVRGSMGHAAQTVLNGMDGLANKHIAKVKLKYNNYVRMNSIHVIFIS